MLLVMVMIMSHRDPDSSDSARCRSTNRGNRSPDGRAADVLNQQKENLKSDKSRRCTRCVVDCWCRDVREILLHSLLNLYCIVYRVCLVVLE
jgi:hypothetical protein